jgi:hypothetical protein
LRDSYGEIRQSANGNVAVLRSVAMSLRRLAGEVTRSERRAALLVEARALQQQIDSTDNPVDSDRSELQAAAARLVTSLAADTGVPVVQDPAPGRATQRSTR